MSTNSIIGIRNRDNTIEYVSCHWDGYLKHNGFLLHTCYNTEKRVRDLLDFGEISSLGMTTENRDEPFITESSFFGSTFYARDRNEKGTSSQKCTMDEFLERKYEFFPSMVYIWDSVIGIWVYSDNKKQKKYDDFYILTLEDIKRSI